ncbi:MAG: hypothetical protein ACTS73_00930 [Arsenophonus sp. NEOnobi-MAG3]
MLRLNYLRSRGDPAQAGSKKICFNSSLLPLYLKRLKTLKSCYPWLIPARHLHR